MTVLQNEGVNQKAGGFLQTHVLTLPRFDSFLQGSLIVLILLQSNIYLLLRRDFAGGQTPAYVEDWVLVSTGGAEFLLGSALGWWGRKRRNLALTAWLGAAAVTSSLVMIFPFELDRSPFVELCGGDTIPRASADTQEIYKSVRLGLLVVGAIFCSLAQISLWAHGLTYLDDHDPKNGPQFYGVLTSIRMSLGLSGQAWLQPASFRDDWWHVQLSLCSLTLMFALLFTLFPAQMKEFPPDEALGTSTNPPERPGYLPTLQRLAANRVLVLQTIALSLMYAAVFGFVHYDKAYVQAKFHIEAYRNDPRTSRAVTDIFRALVVIFFIMIFRVRFSERRPDGVKAGTAARVGAVVAVVAGAFSAAIAGLACPLAPLAGARGTYEQPECSRQCGCDSARYGYSPVCALESDTTYFSPCHAGCTAYEELPGLLLFANCSCGLQRAAGGGCSLLACQGVFTAYQVLYTVFLAVSGVSILMQGMVVLRAARRLDKPVAMGASVAVIGLLATGVGHLLYMLISYLTCLYPEDGRCVLHKETIWIVPALSAVLSVCAAVVSGLASRTSTMLSTKF